MTRKNKNTLLFAGFSGLAIAITLSIGFTKGLPSIFTAAQQDANSLIISANNPVHDGYVKTTKGAAIYVKDDGVTWGSSNLTFAVGGYLQTLTCIHGIQSVNVEMSSGSLDLYHGYLEPTNLETPMYGVDFSFTSTTTYTYNFDLPNYVRLRASSGAVVNKITINYDCVSVTVDQNVETLDDGLENSYIDAGAIKTYATTSYVLDTSSEESKRALRADFKGTTNNYINLNFEMNKLAGLFDELPDFTNKVVTLKAKFSDNITDHGLSIQAVVNNWTGSGYLSMDSIETVNGWTSYQFDFTDVNFENIDKIIRVNINPIGITSSNKDTAYVIFDEIDYHLHMPNQSVRYETIYDGLENVTLDSNWQNVDYDYDNQVTYGRVSRSSLVVRPQSSLGSHPHYCAILSPEAHVSGGLAAYLGINFAESVLIFEYKPINVKNPNTIFVHFLESWSNSAQKTVTTTALRDGWYLFSYDMRQLGFTSPDMIRIKLGFDVESSNLNKAKVYFDNIRVKNEPREDYTQGLENLDIDAGMSPCCSRAYDFTKTSSDSSLNSLKCVLNGDNTTTSWQNKYGPTWVLLDSQLPQMTCNSGRFEARLLFSGDFPDKKLWFNIFDANWQGARFKGIEPTPIGNGWYQFSIDLATLPTYAGEKAVSETFDFSSHPVRFGFGFHSLDSSNNYNKTVWFDDIFYYPETTSSDFTLWQAYDTENIRQGDATLPNRGISTVNPLAFHDAKNGTDSSQLMIKANSTISSYNFRPGTLRGDNGDTLSATCFDVSVAKYFYISGVTSESDKTGYMGEGWYPDALVPIDRIIKANENTITNGNQQSIWINCAIPKHQTPGTYTGFGTLTVDGVDYSIPMKVVVYDVTLSGATHNKTCFLIWYDRMAIAEPYYTNVTRRAYYDFLLEKGISGDSYYEWSRWTVGDMDIYDSFADNFANYIMPNDKISTYRIPMEKTEESVLNYLTALVNRNKVEWDKGNHVNFFDKAIIILSDEPSNPKWNDTEPQAWKDCKSVQNWIKSAQAALAPSLANYPEILAGLNDVRNVVTIGCDYDRITGGGLFYKDLLTTDYFSVPCPQFQLVSPQNQRQTFLSRFNHSWFYGCVHPQLPYPSYHMDTPLLGQRMITWMQYNYGFEGTLYFCVNMFSTSDQGEAVLRDVWTDPMVGNTAGDGMLLYPGSRYNIFGPITSMRLETIRNSMEDYELFYLMDQRLDKYNANTGSSLTSCRDLLSSEVSQMFSGTQLLTSGHTFSSGYQSQDFEEYRIYLLQRLEYCY